MTYREICERLMKAEIESAEWEATALLEHFCHVKKSEILLAPERDYEDEKLSEAVKRREKREPLQYLLGIWEFCRETYRVTPDCLIPRSDTEVLVEEAVKLLPRNACFADFCTGSGCIAVSTLAARTDTNAVALDISAPALELAKENAERNGVKNRLRVEKADLLHLPVNFCRNFAPVDAILSNPPYIKTDVLENLSEEVKKEPKLALDGGADGLTFYRKLLPLAKEWLKKDGFCLFEIGFDQAEDLKKLSFEAGFSCQVKKDYGGNDRLVLLRRED